MFPIAAKMSARKGLFGVHLLANVPERPFSPERTDRELLPDPLMRISFVVRSGICYHRTAKAGKDR
jgi:hypothetical protein